MAPPRRASSWLPFALFVRLGVATNWTYQGQVKVGILHSLTGTMAISEQTVVNAEMMAINEINAAGGLLGLQVVPVVRDGASNWTRFAELADSFTKPGSPDYVKVVFGCWTSASRKAVLPVFERNNHMLFYPLQYEGQECSKNIFYTGAAPNQQIEPAVDWLLRYKAKNFFLVGSDYVFPRTANEIIKAQTVALGGSIAGEMYLQLGEQSDSLVGAVVSAIKTNMPNGGAILNTLNGDSNVKFFQLLYAAGLSADKYPVMSFSITETEIAVIGPQYLTGHYAAWNYFMSTMDSPMCPGGFDPTPSKRFVESYRALYGSNELVNDPMEAAYIAVYMWAQAVSLVGTFDLEPVRRNVLGQVFAAPEGEVVMQKNHHIAKFVRLGQVLPSGDFSLVYESTRSALPEPWNTWVSSSRGRACDWSAQVNDGFYKQDTVEIALVHALSGPRAAVEKQHLEAEIAAIKSLNRNGGVLGLTVLFKIYDTGSNDTAAAQLMGAVAGNAGSSGAVAIFGRAPPEPLVTSALQGTRANGGGPPPVFSPSRTVFGECSEHTLHLGGTMRQQALPAVEYFSQRARGAGLANAQFFIIIPAELQGKPLAVLSSYISSLGDVVVGTAVVGNSTSAAAAAASILQAMPNGGAVLCLLPDPDRSMALLLAMQARSISPGKYPVCLFGVAESDIAMFGSLLKNEFVSLPYVASLPLDANTVFVGVMQEYYGLDYVITDHNALAFSAVTLWAAAAEAAGDFGKRSVMQRLWNTTYPSPLGNIDLTVANYLAMPGRIGALNGRGTGFRALTTTSTPLDPMPFWLQPDATDMGACDLTTWTQILCPAGKGLALANGSLTYSRGTAAQCVWCPPGYASVPLDGATSPTEATRMCTACSPGYSQPSPASTSCAACAIGTASGASAQPTCANCGTGTYQDMPGQSACKACASPMTTAVVGADNEASCICPSGMYVDTGGVCQDCPEGLLCVAGSAQANLPASVNSTALGPFPVTKEGYWNTYADQFSVYQCLSDDVCPGGAPETCGEKAQDLVCGKCGEGYHFLQGVCVPCNGGQSSLAVPLLVTFIIAPIVIFFIHSRSQDPPDLWSSDPNALNCLLLLVLYHLQAISVINAMAVWFPTVMIVFMALTTWSQEIFGTVFHECTTDAAGFTPRAVFRMFSPVYLALVFLYTYCISLVLERLVSKRFHMNRNLVWSSYGAVLFTLFMAVVNVAITIFQCYEHPNKKFSLRTSPNVLCFEKHWWRVAGASIIAVLLFCVGFLVMVGVVLWVTPNRVKYPDFVQRWKFLYVRFRAGSQYWSLVVLLKALSLNMSTVFFTSGRAQIIWYVATMVIYLSMCALMTPWRWLRCTFMDICSCWFMISVACLCMAFSDKSNAVSSFSIAAWAVGLTVIPMGFWLVLCWTPFYNFVRVLLRLKKPPGKEVAEKRLDEVVEAFSKAIDPKALKESLQHANFQEMEALYQARRFFHHRSGSLYSTSSLDLAKKEVEIPGFVHV